MKDSESLAPERRSPLDRMKAIISGLTNFYIMSDETRTPFDGPLIISKREPARTSRTQKVGAAVGPAATGPSLPGLPDGDLSWRLRC